MGIAAAIDIGSNSVRLLVAQIDGDRVKPVYKGSCATGLGMGMDDDMMLSSKSVQTTLSMLEEYRLKALSMGAEDIVIIATSAIRDASNGGDLVESVHRLGLEVQVLDGNTEAEIGYIGVKMGYKGPRNEIFMVDIGGGSTELVTGTKFKIKQQKSIDVGAVRMTERFIRHDPIKIWEMKRIEEYVTDVIIQNARDINIGNEEMVGIGGTVTSLAAIALGIKQYDAGLIHGFVLTSNDVCEILKELSIMNSAQRKEVPGLQPGRTGIIVAGTIILKSLMEYWGYTKLTVSEWDNLEGILKKVQKNKKG